LETQGLYEQPTGKATRCKEARYVWVQGWFVLV